MNDSEEPGEQAGAARSVFVSYARADRRHAVRIVHLLERAGYNVWWDGLLEVGERFSEITERALESAQAVIVLWSQTSVASHWVQDEAGRGRDRRRLIPISIDGSMPPLGFRQFQVIDVSRARLKPGSREAQQIFYAVDQFLGNAEDLPRPPPVGLNKPRVNRRALLVGGTAAVAVLGGGALTLSEGWLTGKPESGSIAVLPFANLSGDPKQDYFSDGLAEELRATLSQDPQLAVAAQTSSNAFRGREVDAVTIANRLKVADILDGSVRRSGGDMRIIVQLIDGSQGFEKWTRTFERKVSDIFKVQTEIAYLVADALVKRLSAEAGNGMRRIGGTDNAAAYDAYLQGKAAYEKASSEAEDRKALALFDKAVELDTDYAVAHAARSTSLTVIANAYSSGSELEALYDRAIAAARKALQIAPDLPEANVALGFVLFNGRLDAQAAKEPYEHSFQVGFGNARVLAAYASYAAHIGEFSAARQAIERAEQLDPLNAAVFRTAGTAAYEARDFEEASRGMEMALSLDPSLANVHSTLGNIAVLKGDLAGARAQFQREPRRIDQVTGLAIVSARGGESVGGDAAFSDLVDQLGDNSLYQQAEVAAQRGDTGGAIGLLERAYQAGDSGLVLSRNDPMLDPLRGQRRFTALLQKMGFDPVSTT